MAKHKSTVDEHDIPPDFLRIIVFNGEGSADNRAESEIDGSCSRKAPRAAYYVKHCLPVMEGDV